MEEKKREENIETIEGIEESKSDEDTSQGETAVEEPIDDVEEVFIQDNKEKLRDILIQADNVIFGEEIGNIEIDIEVKEDEKSFIIEAQANDLLDDLLSTIPDKERTQNTLDKIDRTIQYFKELREKFSNFDSDCFITSFKKHGIRYKPLLDKLVNLHEDLRIVLPVVKQKILFMKPQKTTTKNVNDKWKKMVKLVNL